MSSSGHLVIFQNLFGMEEPQVFFDLMLHVGTLVAILLVLRADVMAIAAGSVSGARKTLGGGRLKDVINEEPHARLALLIVVACGATGFIGLLFRKQFEQVFGSMAAVGSMLLITGGLLWLTRWRGEERKGPGEISILDALLVGAVQGLALLPGISRSGSTIAVGLFRGLDRDLAARFSFLVSVPAIIGSSILEVADHGLSASAAPPVIAGTLTAGLVGYFALRLLIRIVVRGSLSGFSYYCWIVGGLAIVAALF